MAKSQPAEQKKTQGEDTTQVRVRWDAKCLSVLLGNVVKEYESRWGELKVDAGSPGAPGTPAATGQSPAQG